jgi:hypothetical protein
MGNVFGFGDGRIPLNPGSTVDPSVTGNSADSSAQGNRPAGVAGDFAAPNPSDYGDYTARGFRGPVRHFFDGREVIPNPGESIQAAIDRLGKLPR